MALDWERTEFRELIIHEICHAVTRNKGHAKSWEKMMIQTAEIVKAKGEPALAEKIVKDVETEEDPQYATAEGIYGVVEDGVRDGASLEAIRAHLRSKKIMTDDELDRRYKKINDVSLLSKTILI